MSPTTPLPRIAYRPAEAAEVLGCSRQHIYNLMWAGELPSFKRGRARFIPADALVPAGGAAA